MICYTCKDKTGKEITMESGVALIPAWGNRRNNHSRGQTLYHVGAVIGSVVKCPNCGHSVSFHGRIMKILPTNGYVYTQESS